LNPNNIVKKQDETGKFLFLDLHKYGFKSRVLPDHFPGIAADVVVIEN